MVKVNTPGLSAAEKEKYMVAVKKHGKLPDVIVTRETTATTFTIDTNSVTKTTVVCDSKKAMEKANSLNKDTDIEVDDHVDVETVSMETDNEKSNDHIEIKSESSDKSYVNNSTPEKNEKDNFRLPDSQRASDVMIPLSIETNVPSSSGPDSESTDTASEVGSCFSSPSSTFSSCNNSPQISGPLYA